MLNLFPGQFNGGVSRGRAGLMRTFATVYFTCILLVVITSCAKHQESKPDKTPIEVTTVVVTPKDLPVAFKYVAQTQSSHQVNIQARVSGFLDKRLYVEGSMVKSGQVLFLMDKKPFRAQVNGAAAALARQKAAMETARLNLERIKPLVAQDALSQKDLDEANGSYQSTAAAVAQARAQLETAQLNLSYCTIASPVSGITGAALQQDGTFINQQNSQLTTVSVLSPMWVNFSISENEMQRFRDKVARKVLIPPRDGNYEVSIILVDGSLFPHKGKITFAAPSYNAQTGTFLIRASVDNPDGTLRPNQYVRAILKGAIKPGAILVPQRAVHQGGKGHYVWVVNKDGKAEYRPVTVGEWYGNDWMIDEGLRQGDRVVVDGGMALQPGFTVTIKQ